MGCASPVIEKDGGGARLGGPGGEGAMLTSALALAPAGAAGAGAVAKLGDDKMTLDEMIANYSCSSYDAYGPKVTAIKVGRCKLKPETCVQSAWFQRLKHNNCIVV